MARLLPCTFLALLLELQLALSARVTNSKKVPKNAVLLSKVSSLTVRAGQKTASRRVSPVPQLQCVGSPEICKLYSVDVMRCTNEGSDYDAESIQWACKASLPDEFKLGSTDVTCEGYESSDDPYVLKGSCGVEYKLMLTEHGAAKYGKSNDYRWPSGETKSSETYAGYLFMVVFLIVLFIIFRSLYQAWQRDGPRGGGPRLGGAGWGGGPGDDDPPPPYDDGSYNAPKKRAYTPRTSTGTRASSSRANAGNQQQGWRPGFWTGTAAGAAAGYLAGNRGQARTQPETVERRTGGGLFGGGGGSGSGIRQAPSGPSSSTPSFSSSRHESTGFGSTSRRSSPSRQADLEAARNTTSNRAGTRSSLPRTDEPSIPNPAQAPSSNISVDTQRKAAASAVGKKSPEAMSVDKEVANPVKNHENDQEAAPRSPSPDSEPSTASSAQQETPSRSTSRQSPPSPATTDKRSPSPMQARSSSPLRSPGREAMSNVSHEHYSASVAPSTPNRGCTSSHSACTPSSKQSSRSPSPSPSSASPSPSSPSLPSPRSSRSTPSARSSRSPSPSHRPAISSLSFSFSPFSSSTNSSSAQPTGFHTSTGYGGTKRR